MDIALRFAAPAAGIGLAVVAVAVGLVVRRSKK
jgi:hypothetical protein